MRIIVAILVSGLIVWLLASIDILIDKYKYPVCPKCGDNRFCERINGKIICTEHGKIRKDRK